MSALTLPQYALLSSDDRRKAQAKVVRHLPADAAAALLLMLPNGAHLGSRLTTWTPTEHESGVAAFRRERVLVPLVEPNVLAFGRMITRSPQAPRPTTGPDGVLLADWASPAAHAAAARDVVRIYRDTHSLIEPIAERAAWGLDSWHSPLALVPVRHTYRDGSKPVLRWMAADGTARIIGARLAYTRLWNTWLTDHPWTDPEADWPADAVTMRRFLAAARTEAQRLADEANTSEENTSEDDTDQPEQDPDDEQYGRKHVHPDFFLHEPRIEDWADILLPSPATDTYGRNGLADQVEMWNARSHGSSRMRNPDDEADRYPSDVTDAIERIDVFSGRDPFDIVGGSPTNRSAREEVAYSEEQVREFLLNGGNNPREQASRAALFAVALLDGASLSLDRDTDPYLLLRDYLRANLTAEPMGAERAASITAAIRVLTERLGPPRLTDLYGVWGDLTAGEPNEPLLDPGSPWFWIGAAQGIAYAILLGHLPSHRNRDHDFARVLVWLLVHPRGQQQITAYTTACQAGRVRVPLATLPGEFASAQRLRTTAQADLATLGVAVGEQQ